jgi:hypothetical protein
MSNKWGKTAKTCHQLPPVAGVMASAYSLNISVSGRLPLLPLLLINNKNKIYKKFLKIGGNGGKLSFSIPHNT